MFHVTSGKHSIISEPLDCISESPTEYEPASDLSPARPRPLMTEILPRSLCPKLTAPALSPGTVPSAAIEATSSQPAPSAFSETCWTEIPRHGGPARDAVTPAWELLTKNRFSALSVEPISDSKTMPPILRGGNANRFNRVAEELHEYFKAGRRRKLPRHPPPFRHKSNKASELKCAIFDYIENKHEISVPWPKLMGANPPLSRLEFWNRISLSRLRFKDDKRSYVVIREADPNGHARILQLHVPPVGPYSEAHAEAQATYRDDGEIFARGLRVFRERLLELGAPAADVQKLYDGYEVALKHWPAQARKRNYGGALDYPDKLAEETQRLLEAGFIEGPLHYAPHVVQGMGGIWKPEKQKWRTVMDATSSGVNPASVHLGAEYDMLEHALSDLRPGQYMSAFDLTDAFCNWPYTPAHSDLWGFRDELSGHYFRYRFMAFGGAQSPAVQQHWARILKKIVSEHGLRYCRPGSEAARRSDGFRCAAAYLDDFHLHHPVDISREAAEEQFDSVLQLLDYLGIRYKSSKNIRPTKCCEFIGLIIDSVAETVTISDERAAKLRDEIAEFLAGQPAGSSIPRRKLAALVGKLQWVARVVPAGQFMLRSSYDSLHALDADVASRPVAERWRSDVMCPVTLACRRDLSRFSLALQQLKGRPIYLNNLSTDNGIWTGIIPESDELLDADGSFGVSVEDVEVLTGDAAGSMGGGWWRHRRMAFEFEPAFRAPRASSNYRELATALEMLKRWGPEMPRGQRVLIRTDNITTAACVNKQSTKHATLRPLVSELVQLVSDLGLDVRARHIPGLKNLLADRLSRQLVLASRDDGDWRFRHDEFRVIESYFPRKFDVDACADPLGHNAHCERFYSRLDSCLEHSWSGLHTWCNADWEILEPVLAHFRKCYAASPDDTSAVFVVPVWPSARWWRLLRGARVVHVYEAGTRLFSAPGPPSLTHAGVTGLHGVSQAATESHRSPAKRRDCGATNWDTAVLYFPSACRLLSRGTESARGDGIDGGHSGGTGQCMALRGPELCGATVADIETLRSVSKRALQHLRRADF